MTKYLRNKNSRRKEERMHVYLLIMKNGGIIVDAKVFLDCEVAIQMLRVENEFHDESVLYNIDIRELDDKARKLKKCISI